MAAQAVHTREATDATGGVYREDDGEPFPLECVALKAERGLALGEAGVRGARRILARKDAGLRMHDRVALPGETGRLAVTELREMPRHVRARLEEAP